MSVSLKGWFVYRSCDEKREISHLWVTFKPKSYRFLMDNGLSKVAPLKNERWILSLACIRSPLAKACQLFMFYYLWLSGIGSLMEVFSPSGAVSIGQVPCPLDRSKYPLFIVALVVGTHILRVVKWGWAEICNFGYSPPKPLTEHLDGCKKWLVLLAKPWSRS